MSKQQSALTTATLLFLTLLVSACGFALRGAHALPYESVYVSGADYAIITAGLKRAITASGAKVATNEKEADAIFIPTAEFRQPVILSLSGSGRVREKRLVFSYSFRLVDKEGRDLIPKATVQITRDISYSDSEILAKEQEEALLWRDMESDVVSQVMRRLSVKPYKKQEEQ